ncbi:hypothetical protein NECAME_07242 [Necator americanus]|uniref:Thioesterase domain-containing protein n=1 Tax=Necator americanus TaxID=51031 RepID=W2TNU8_NECAM|nr:hypothetical protein NECAME_07242 [Necator americanus]ETN83755.1 hypothetical protein NECAME_07242 [Necator americanus]
MIVGPEHVNAKELPTDGRNREFKSNALSPHPMKIRNYIVVNMLINRTKSKEMRLNDYYHLFDNNLQGTLHGGQTASLTDIVTARAVGLTIKDQALASIELSVSYMLPVQLGDVIEITAYVLKLGRNVAFTEAEFRRRSDGKLAAKGRHTLAILPKQPNRDGAKLAQF